MRKALLAAVLVLLPLGSALAQREGPYGVYFFGSIADDRTTRPSGFNPNCWESTNSAGLGALFEYTTPVSITVSSGFHYLGQHKNKNCTPQMELNTSVIPVTVGYAIALGDYIALTPKIGFSYMYVSGTYNGRDDSNGSVKPTYGIALEGRLNRHWGLRGELNRYTGRTQLFGTGEFQQDFRVAQFGGVFRW